MSDQRRPKRKVIFSLLASRFSLIFLFTTYHLPLTADLWAQAQQPVPPSPLVSLIPLLVIFAIFYFLLIRPQQKKMKAHRKMIENLKKGDKVVTSSGFWATIVGEVSKDQEFIEIEIAKNVRARILKNSISELRRTETPSPENK